MAENESTEATDALIEMQRDLPARVRLHLDRFADSIINANKRTPDGRISLLYLAVRIGAMAEQGHLEP